MQNSILTRLLVFLLSFWLFCVCVNVACSIGSIMLLASSHSVEKSPKMSHFQKWLKIVLLHFWRQNSNFNSQNDTFFVIFTHCDSSSQLTHTKKEGQDLHNGVFQGTTRTSQSLEEIFLADG